jgi:hypothetical protein
MKPNARIFPLVCLVTPPSLYTNVWRFQEVLGFSADEISGGAFPLFSLFLFDHSHQPTWPATISSRLTLFPS